MYPREIKKEIIGTVNYLKEHGCTLPSLEAKLEKLNYYEITKGKFNFVTKSGINYVVDLTNGGGYYTPVVRKDSNIIDDYVICLEKVYCDSPEYIVHELLHFLSTKDVREEKIKCGIVNFNSTNYIEEGLEAINEGITDFFTFRICGKCFNSKYYRLYSSIPEETPYYYATLLINLLVFGSRYKKDKLLKAYIENDDKYIFKEIQKCFGLSKGEAKKIFAEVVKYYYNPKDKVLKNKLKKEIKQVVNYYYSHLSPKMKDEYKNFEKIYLSKFKSLYK